MKKTTYAIDNSAILYLSLIRKDHTNTYRFTATLTQPVCPDVLQRAVDQVYCRFPTVIAGFRPGFFHYRQVRAEAPPKVLPDPGCLVTMTKQEIHTCAYRVYYRENTITIEAFHALADGFGAIASFTTLTAEYLRLKYGAQIPVEQTLVDLQQSPSDGELEDSYLHYKDHTPLHLPSRYAYQLPGGNGGRECVRTAVWHMPTRELLDTARRHGVSLTALLSTVMAASIMELQHRQAGQRIRPVRIMVPVDLRRMFPSRTLRNFILYVLPTMEPQERGLPLSRLLRSFRDQIQEQTDPSRLASIMAYNVRTQEAWYFRLLPLTVKCALMRLVYRFFGESNSSVTLTNLGNVPLPEQMQPYVSSMDVVLTPRVRSPYNCAIISCGGKLSVTISRFPRESELEAIFSHKLQALMDEEAQL